MTAAELKHIMVLQSLDTEALNRLGAVLEEDRYSDGEVIFAEGEPGETMYFIADGCIRIEKETHAAGVVHKTLAMLEAGDYFGEMALLNQRPRAATAVAAGNAHVLRLSKAAFDQIHQTSSGAALSLLFGMIRTASDRIRWLSTQLVAYDEVGKAIGEGRDLQFLLNLILEQLSAACGSDWAFLVLRSEFSGRLDLRAQVNLELSLPQREAISQGEGFLGPILRGSQDVLAPAFQEHELFKGCARLGFETTSLLACPILLAAQVVGLIVLGGKESQQFDLNTVNLVRGIARQAAQAILNTRHREEDEARFRHLRPSIRG